MLTKPDGKILSKFGIFNCEIKYLRVKIMNMLKDLLCSFKTHPHGAQ